MTYGELLDALKQLDSTQLDDTALVWDTVHEEYIPILGFKVSQMRDQTDMWVERNHAYMTI